MKKYLVLGILLIILGVVVMQKETVLQFYYKYILQKPVQVTLEKNQYYRDYDFKYVQNTEDFSPNDKQEIINIFYTAINSGQKTFTFYCPNRYKDCTQDVEELANDQTLLSHINNFVHPYNGFKHIETEYDSLGQVTIRVYKNYTNEEIRAINEKVDNIYQQIVVDDDSDQNKIKIIHDYIINHSKYDSLRSDQNIVNYKSDIAYGPLFEGYALCGGYTDAMELFLEKMGLKSYKISSENHVWNAVYLDGKWYHLDLTWDDPVTTNGSDVLEHNFFLIQTNELNEIETEQHIFDLNIYQEMKEA